MLLFRRVNPGPLRNAGASIAITRRRKVRKRKMIDVGLTRKLAEYEDLIYANIERVRDIYSRWCLKGIYGEESMHIM